MPTRKQPDFKQNFFRCYDHSIQALQRGDYPNAMKWMRLAERHINAATRFEELARKNGKRR